MPELTEVQAHAERLSAAFAGAVLAGFEPLAFTALKTVDPAPDAAVGGKLDTVRRRGKYLLLEVGQVTFVVHLMQGGRLRPDDKRSGGSGAHGGRRRSARPKGGVARWVFTDGRALLLTEAGTERRAGVWVVGGDPLKSEPLSELGPEADSVGEAEMAALLDARPMRLHSFLRDQHTIAGLGRRLANEVCHRARLSPFAPTGRVAAEAGRVVEAIRSCVAEGLEVERARDEMSSSKERPAAVHARTGQACPVCGDTVRAVEYRDYTVNYCATCQTGGKVLADNTTSKFLK